MRDVIEKSQCLLLLAMNSGVNRVPTVAMLIQAGNSSRGSSDPPER